MADIADIAADDIEREREHHLEQQRLKNTTAKASAFYCIGCDEVIPHQRRALVPGVQTCVECQAIVESNRKRGI